MKKKKLAAVMLCLLLTGALAGCGQDAGSTAEVTGGTAFTEDTADTQTTDAAQDMQAADDSGMHAGDLPAAGAGDAADGIGSSQTADTDMESGSDTAETDTDNTDADNTLDTSNASGAQQNASDNENDTNDTADGDTGRKADCDRCGTSAEGQFRKGTDRTGLFRNEGKGSGRYKRRCIRSCRV